MNSRFVNSGLPIRPETRCSPTLDYEDSPVLTLEEAVEKLVPVLPDVMNYVATAKKEKPNVHSILLPHHESTAIYLYTMSGVPFFSSLNTALRNGNRQTLKPWFAFIKLFITALAKLPSTKAVVWRGVNYDATSTFVDDDVYTWWGISSCSMHISAVRAFLGESGTLFIIETISGKDISMFSANPDEQEVVLMPGTRLRAKSSSLSVTDRFFIIHLEEVHSRNKSQCESSYLYERIKQEYRENSRIERFMNPSMSFPIEQSYINLAIVKAKEQRDKEQQLWGVQDATAVMGTFEEIYAIKTVIDIQDIFKSCKDGKNRLLVFGRAGIGKSTFCRYIAYQWARDSYWRQYELLALIPLRRLTTHRYPPDKRYSLLDVVKSEVFRFDLSEKEEELLRKRFDPKKTLWLLDGYDEIVQSVPPHLQCLFEQLLNTPHHIVTSRPYLNTLSYDVQMEITGFTDNNIVEYVQRFFEQMKDELDDASTKSKKLLGFLRSKPSVWGVSHIPVNLELICSLWSNEDWSDTEQLTITALYTMMTEWLCRRYLTAQGISIQTISETEMYQRCDKELKFLESLALNAMKSNTILIRPVLLKKVLNETNFSLQVHSQMLNIGFLKSMAKQGTGSQIETDKDHYFVHLSFQEYFTARHLIRTLSTSQPTTAIDFIKQQKYNQRYALVITFAAGLAAKDEYKSCFELFWNTILTESVDLVGIRHIQLVISCMEESTNESSMPRRFELLQWISSCIKSSFMQDNKNIRQHLSPSLQKAQSVTCDQSFINVLISLLENDSVQTQTEVLRFISELKMLNPSTELLKSVIIRVDHEQSEVRQFACKALQQMDEKAATNEVITKLLSTLADGSEKVRETICEALGKMGEKAATDDVVMKLVSALADENEWVRHSACLALGKIGKEAATNEVITRLVGALADESDWVRGSACEALGQMGEKVATNEVLNNLVSALADENEFVRRSASGVLGQRGHTAPTIEEISKLLSAVSDKRDWVRSTACLALGKICEKATTKEIINKLVSALADESDEVRRSACFALGKMGEKAPTNDAITNLVSALADESDKVRRSACEALGQMGEKAATNEVITSLVSALADTSDWVRSSAWEALGQMGEKAATNEVTTKLVSSVADESDRVRSSACKALGQMGEKTATNEATANLVSALADQSDRVRRSACEGLGKIGEKVATNEVITKLVSTLADESYSVRSSACKALGQMGEKAATNATITSLVSALADESNWVRCSACEALGQMGEKAATNEVITNLVSAIADEDDWVRKSACEALGQMGEKAATNEVITNLVSAIADEDYRVRDNACEALGQMGEKAATNEVITNLVSAIADEDDWVRNSACKALGKMGEKAARHEVISSLVSAIADENYRVRDNACGALGQMGEKAATNEVIANLVSALADESYWVRSSACKALGQMGEKAATNEVITKLVSALADESYRVRGSACEALGQMGEKAATDEVVMKLVSALVDENEWVRDSACKALGKMGEATATNEVVTHLVSVIADKSYWVRSSACEALGQMGEKAATTEVITRLVGALADESDRVRRSACKALGQMGDKTATNEAMTNLVIALGDKSDDVRRSACEALGQMGEKAATTELTTKLVSSVADEIDRVRSSACEALGEMGLKAAMHEKITNLVSALADESDWVRSSACLALGNMGEKAATNEVITKLVDALADESQFVRMSGCRALGKIGERAATNMVITKLVSALKDDSFIVIKDAGVVWEEMGKQAAMNEAVTVLAGAANSCNEWLGRGYIAALDNILTSFAVIKQVNPKVIASLCRIRGTSNCLKDVSEHDLVKLFFETKNSDWLSVITQLAFTRGSAVIATVDDLVLFGQREPLKLRFPSPQLQEQFVGAFIHQAKYLHLNFELPS